MDDFLRKMQGKVPASTDALAYDINGAARAMSIGRNKVYDEIGAGRLEALKVGRRTVITRAAIEAWFASLPRLTTNAA